MSSVTDWRYFPQNRVELLIASSRLVFASFSLLAVWLDPSQPAMYAPVAYGLMMGYIVYSLGIAIITWRIAYPLKMFSLITHIFDMVIFTIFMLFTEGAKSPFFPYIIFYMICGMLRWHLRGVVYTSIGALLTFSAIDFYGSQIVHDLKFDLDTFIVRNVYLIIVAMLLAYTGAHNRRLLNEITALAEWPRPDIFDMHELVQKLLVQARIILGSPRLLAIWEDSEESWLNIALHSEGGFQITRERPEALGEIVPEALKDRNFLCIDTDAPEAIVLCDSPDGFEYLHQVSPIGGELQSRYGIRSVLSMNLQGDGLNGHLIILDKPRMTSDDLVIGKIVAMRISSILNQSYLLRKLQQTAIAEERINLARDLHDGLLQSLSSIGMKVQSVEALVDRNPMLAESILNEVQKLVTFEQRDLRCLIQELKPLENGVRDADISLNARVDELAELIRHNWGIQVKLDIQNLGSAFPRHIEREIYFVLREALVNSAKHAMASSLRVDVELKDDKLNILVIDNGCGFPFHGQYDLASLNAEQIGPRTIKERVGALGGDLTIQSSESGACLRIELPMYQESSE